MRPGTPGFVGEALRAAREARGIATATSLAEMIGVSRAAVSQYELGVQTPSPDVMAEISRVLNLPSQHFVTQIERVEGVHFFRSLASATQSQRIRAQRKYEWLTHLVRFLKSYLEFPKVDFPQLDLPADPRKITDDMIEQAAMDLRRAWGMGDGPISNIAWLLENKGAVTVRMDLDCDKLDAFSRWNPIDETPYVILGTNRGTAARSRFNAAHELAHMLFHRQVEGSQFANGPVFREIEHQANRFAGAFLLPREAFLSELYSVNLDAMKALKPRWKVAIALMLKRAEDLGAIDELRARALWVTLARRGWRRQEPQDSTMPAEEPRFLQRCITTLIENGIVGLAELPGRLGLNPADIVELANLPSDFFIPKGVEHEVAESEPTIIKFPQRERHGA